MIDNQQSSALTPIPLSAIVRPSPLSPLPGDPHPRPSPKGRGEIRAASPIDRMEGNVVRASGAIVRMEGSIVTEMVVNHFRET